MGFDLKPGDKSITRDRLTGETEWEAHRITRRIEKIAPVDLNDPANWDLHLSDTEINQEIISILNKRPAWRTRVGRDPPYYPSPGGGPPGGGPPGGPSPGGPRGGPTTQPSGVFPGAEPSFSGPPPPPPRLALCFCVKDLPSSYHVSACHGILHHHHSPTTRPILLLPLLQQQGLKKHQSNEMTNLLFLV